MTSPSEKLPGKNLQIEGLKTRDKIDLALKLELAKMLPEKLCDIKGQYGDSHISWKTPASKAQHVQETEWLHVCHLIEQRALFGPFNRLYRIAYKNQLHQLNRGNIWSPTWQIRAQALINIFNVQPVIKVVDELNDEDNRT